MEKRDPLLYCWWDYKLLQPLWKTVWRLLKKLKLELPYDPIIPLLGIHPKKMLIKKYMYPNVHNRIIYNRQI